MDRRRFLQAFGLGAVATAATMALDPERLLWRPGEKTFFLPSPKVDRVYDPETGLSLRFVKEWGIHPDPNPQRMDLFFEPPPGFFDDAAKSLADHIDRQALEAYNRMFVRIEG